MQGTSRRILIYIGIIWLGLSTVLFMLFDIIISLLSSFVLLVMLIWYVKREPNQIKITNDDKITKINYYCMSYGTKHSDERCPQCASKKKKVRFYISYLMPISSLMIGSGL
ncbi:MAG TPA: hypothetical protein VIP70_01715 [Nitrososphaeraceae archaeon]